MMDGEKYDEGNIKKQERKEKPKDKEKYRLGNLAIK